MTKVLPLVGIKAYWALVAFQHLVLGLKMLPAYMGESLEDFSAKLDAMEMPDRARVLREAALLVKLEKEEVEMLIAFAADANGVPYGPENMKTLGPSDFINIIVAVALELSKIQVYYVTEAEKKN